MKGSINKLGFFFRTLGGGFFKAWQDSDCYYHIPKSRFNDRVSEDKERDNIPRQQKSAPRNAFLGSFRDCVATAWDEADRQYHIPKTRFMDAKYNGIAYRSSPEPGFVSRIFRFMVTLKHCISMAWDASDIFYHLPKSRYQDPDFIRDLMKLTPSPPGKLLIKPYTVGLGVVVGESTSEGWAVRPSVEAPGEGFVVPDEAGPRKPEITPE
jgi:hypothetical protein